MTATKFKLIRVIVRGVIDVDHEVAFEQLAEGQSVAGFVLVVEAEKRSAEARLVEVGCVREFDRSRYDESFRRCGIILTMSTDHGLIDERD